MSSTRNTLSRSLHDLGLAVWFGGSLMGAVGVNHAAAAAVRRKDATSVAGAGWSAWTPVNLGAIGAYLVGGVGLTLGNKSRLAGQRGVASTAVIKTGLTGVALAATAYSRLIGQRVIDAEGSPAEDGTTPAEGADADIAAAQRQLDILQWVIPATTGALVVLSAAMGEQQRPAQVAKGMVARLGSLPEHLPKLGDLTSHDHRPSIAEHLPIPSLHSSSAA